MVCVSNCIATAFSPGTTTAHSEPASLGASLLIFETVTTKKQLGAKQKPTASRFLLPDQGKQSYEAEDPGNKSVLERSAFLTGAWTNMEQHLQSCRSPVFNRSHTPLLGTTQCDFSCLNRHLHCWLSDLSFRELHYQTTNKTHSLSGKSISSQF